MHGGAADPLPCGHLLFAIALHEACQRLPKPGRQRRVTCQSARERAADQSSKFDMEQRHQATLAV